MLIKWVQIENQNNYQVNNVGQVKNIQTGKILKPSPNTYGYPSVCLSKNGNRGTHSIHTLVAKGFLPNPNNYPCVNHKDEDKTNNVVWLNDDGSINYDKSNLEWCTVEYNNAYGTRVQRSTKNNTNGKCSKPIFQYTLEGEFVKEWPSSMEIERQLYFCHSNITKCCLGKKYYKSAYGYVWKYT